MEIRYGYASGTADFEAISSLQAANLPDALEDGERQGQGFVTVRHDVALLAEMAGRAPQVAAWGPQGELAGYALGMLREFSGRIPVLVPMFEQFGRLDWQGRPLEQCRFLVMGQVCVAKPFRGQGVFDGLYAAFREAYRGHYELVVTQIAERNGRSLRAHARVGFRPLHAYSDPRGEAWQVVAWDWR